MSRQAVDCDTGEDHVLGLDLGKAQDYTALVSIKRTARPDPHKPAKTINHYGIDYLKRWPLGTSYTAIVADLRTLTEKPPLRDSLLAADGTGVGSAVVEMVRAADVPVKLRPFLITAGHEVTMEAGVHHVPKKELVSTLQVLIQTERLKIAALPERELLFRELLAFKVKITAAANETYESWREKDHDDIVLAVALACWLGERPRREIWVM